MKYTLNEMDNIVSTKLNNCIDEYVLFKRLNSKSMTIKQIYNLIDFNTYIDTEYNDITYIMKSRTWYKNEFRNSEVCKLLCGILKDLKKYKLTIEKMLDIITAILYQNGDNKRVWLLHDRFICKKCQISRKTLYIAVYLLRKCNIITCLNLTDTKIYIKIDLNLLVYDPVILRLIDRQKNVMHKIYSKCEQEKSDTCEGLDYGIMTSRTLQNTLKQTVLGIIYYYNFYTDSYCIQKECCKDNKIHVIKYITIPYHILSIVTGYTETDLRAYISKLFTSTNYISSYDKIYIDKVDKYNNNIISHYKTENYDKFPMIKLRNVNNVTSSNYIKGKLHNSENNIIYYKDTHRSVSNKYSAIMFLDNFRHTNLYKTILKKRTEIETLIGMALKTLHDTKYEYVTCSTKSHENSDINNLSMNPYFVKDNLLKVHFKSFSENLISGDYYKCNQQVAFNKLILPKLRDNRIDRVRTGEDIRHKVSIINYKPQNTLDYVVKLAKAVKSIVDPEKGFQNNCRKQDLKYYSNCVVQIHNLLNDTINWFRTNNRIDEIHKLFDRFNLYTYFPNVIL